ncbi:DUF1631 family protein [Roseateles sp. BYS180W]|uniref:DUF1631 family protein n=1 Tax=Roseateles rivi TaxID=3299028 RepID=A0ABW7FWI7_9BURK
MTDSSPLALSAQARQVLAQALHKGLPALLQVLDRAADDLVSQVAEHGLQMARRDAMERWRRAGRAWVGQLQAAVTQAALQGWQDSRPRGVPQDLALVGHEVIEREILVSRLAMALLDQASWEFNDLRLRMLSIEGGEDLPPNDILRHQVLGRQVLTAWADAGLGHEVWQFLQATLHQELGHLAYEAYHECNRWLIAQGVLPDVNLRPLIRRLSDSTQEAPISHPATVPDSVAAEPPLASRAVERRVAPKSQDAAQQVLAQLQRVLARHVMPSVGDAGGGGTSSPGAAPDVELSISSEPSPRFKQALVQAQAALRPERAKSGDTLPISLDQMRQRQQDVKQALKDAAESPAERATVEVVAMLFQSILMEERIPPAVRVWFARLQMPVLRVALAEPDFFASTDHPARLLIDRMGVCVMGFNTSSANLGDALEREIKRIAQVVEAYPDTGRRVFQAVLTEFEKFLDHYFQTENEASRKGVSLAQQIEQRETLAIQYTIELRKMLAEVPVQEGVRDFLFQTWADVLAVTAMRSGAESTQTAQMRSVAADLIWSASAKVSREERAEVIQRLPTLLKTLREGMRDAGLSVAKQDSKLQELNTALTAAFAARSAVIPKERLDELMEQLHTLVALLPGEGEHELDEMLVRNLSAHECDDLEVVAEGGGDATDAMLKWAKSLQLGEWYMLDYRGRVEPVQLAWQGAHQQLNLFVSAQGRGVLFQLTRLAAFLHAGLLLPAQDEALTVKATRSVLAKLEVDPSRLYC